MSANNRVMSGNSAPKPPKKRFLEAAVAHQKLMQQQEEQQQMQSGAKAEDNSALMQLAEMCVLYRKDSCCDTSQPHSNCSILPEEEENEKPLDLSGEHTIRTNQQDLIDHLVDKLCCRPITEVKQRELKTQETAKDPVKEMPQVSNQVAMKKLITDESAVLQTCSSEVSSTIDVKGTRKDLPLKKRDSTGMKIRSRAYSDQVVCDSSTAEIVVGESKGALVMTGVKPAQRSCKGKRYLEFMYEGRASMGSRVKRMEIERTDLVETPIVRVDARKKRCRKAKRIGSGKVNRKSRQLS